MAKWLNGSGHHRMMFILYLVQEMVLSKFCRNEASAVNGNGNV